MNLSIVILRYLLQLRLFENRCASVDDVAAYLEALKLRANSVKKHIEKLVKEGLTEIRGNTVCAREDLRAVLVATGDD
jgi:predicted ArsR family transcriptional regulator